MGIAWPPIGEDAELLERLRLLIERAGASHFLDVPVVRADERDFPEPFRPTGAAVERLLARLCWLGYVDLEVKIDDLRAPTTDPTRMLSRSVIEWMETTDGVAHFQREQIGNDNIAGLLSHEVGRAFVAWLSAAAPYREETPEPPSAQEGSIAAIYLGLGVIAANASLYQRRASELVGRSVVSENEVVVTGGLSPRALLYLLAVQAVLRGAPIEAHATLRRDLADLLRELIAQLTPRRAELAERLGLDLAAPRAALERDPAPATVTDAERPDPDLRRRWSGYSVTRVQRSQWAHGLAVGTVLGGGVAVSALLLDSLIGSSAIVSSTALILGGGLFVASVVSGGRSKVDHCSGCSAPTPAGAELCPGCGATVVSLAELERLRREAEARDDATDVGSPEPD
jgi:hypothetical protein